MAAAAGAHGVDDIAWQNSLIPAWSPGQPVRHWSQFDAWVTWAAGQLGIPIGRDETLQPLQGYSLPDPRSFYASEKAQRDELFGRGALGIEGVHTVGDGSCFLHAAFLSCSPVYRRIAEDNHRSLIIQRFRREEFYSLFQPTVFNSRNASGNYLFDQEKSIVSAGNFTAFLEQRHILVFFNTYKINALILSTNPPKYPTGGGEPHTQLLFSSDVRMNPATGEYIYSNYEKFNQNGYPFLCIVNHGQGHFSSVRFGGSEFMLEESMFTAIFPSISAGYGGSGRAGVLSEANVRDELEAVPSRLAPRAVAPPPPKAAAPVPSAAPVQVSKVLHAKLCDLIKEYYKSGEGKPIWFFIREGHHNRSFYTLFTRDAESNHLFTTLLTLSESLHPNNHGERMKAFNSLYEKAKVGYSSDQLQVLIEDSKTCSNKPKGKNGKPLEENWWLILWVEVYRYHYLLKKT